MALRKARELAGGTPRILSLLGYGYAATGKQDEARQDLEELEELSRHRYVSPYEFALVHLGLSEHARALDALEKAYEEKSLWLVWLNVHPLFDPLHSEPRFEALVSAIGLEAK